MELFLLNVYRCVSLILALSVAEDLIDVLFFLLGFSADGEPTDEQEAELNHLSHQVKTKEWRFILQCRSNSLSPDFYPDVEAN